jgi:Pyruvate/2-oxoacid:ferredoxin oxidoreductase gamma subunit
MRAEISAGAGGKFGVLVFAARTFGVKQRFAPLRQAMVSKCG